MQQLLGDEELDENAWTEIYAGYALSGETADASNFFHTHTHAAAILFAFSTIKRDCFFVTLSRICVNFTAFKSQIDSFDWLYYSSLRYIKNRVQALLFCLDLTYFPEIFKRVLGLAMTHLSSGLSMTSEAY